MKDIIREKYSTFQEGPLPNGWTAATIGELIALGGNFIDGDWVESKDQDPLGEVRLIQLADIGDGEYRDRSARFLTLEKAKELGCTFLETEDVLIARMPDPLGRACIFPGDNKPSVTVVDVCIVRTGEGGPNHRWLMYTINSPAFRSAVANLQSGTTRQRISRSNLAILEIPVPPLAEQHRIVLAIEQQFTRLDAGISALKRAQAKLKRYRAAVLKAAVEGKLTEAWRAEHPATEPASILLERILKERRARWEADLRAKGKDPAKVKYVEPAKPDMEGLPELPEGWCWATIEQVSQCIVDCLHSTPKFKESGFLCIDTNCIKPGRIVSDKVRYVDEETFIERNRRMKPKENDVIFSREGALLGVAVRVPSNLEFCLGQRMMIFRLDQCIDASFHEKVLNSSVFRSQYLHEITGSASPHLNIQGIRRFKIPLPPFVEQQIVVAEVERRLSIVEKLESNMEANLKRAERLRQSILKEAFAGRLVPQDPNDEPANVLLERIRKEREGQKKGAKGNGRFVRVSSKPVQIDVEGTRQVELWEGVGGGE